MAGEADSKKRLNFDPTINAGHLLTFATLVVMLIIGWNNLDKRVVVVEEARAYQRERDNAQDKTIDEKLQNIKDTLSDVKRGVEQLKDRKP